MKAKLYFIPLALAAVCLISAFAVRFSYTDAGNQIYDYPYNASDTLADYLKENNVSSPQDLIREADVIVKAKYNGERQVTTDAFFSQVTVSQVYKGDKALVGKDLCVIETVSVFPKTRYIPSKGFLIPLQTGGEYILLLKQRQFDPGRELDEFQKSQYYPVMKGAFGYYKVSNKKQTQLMSADRQYTLNSLKGMDLFATDQQVLNTYYQYKEQILKMIEM